MYIDLQRNLQYYNSEQSIPCDCDICKNYYSKVKAKYPQITEYLSSLNVDILRPFELVWFENEKQNQIEYIGCQYIVFGKCENSFQKQIGDVVFEINTDHHPDTKNIQGEHFILDFGKIILEPSNKISF